jgi:hemerythrin-like metal-binding protein/PAS domain S-box-containing protein
LFRSGTLQVAAVFLLGLSIAAGGALLRQQVIDREATTLFQHSVERVSAEIARRFRQPTYGLNGARGVYAASKRVQRAEFLAYVESRNLSREFPGVRGFGFIQRVMRSDLDAFVAAERADGAPEFAVRQLADRDHEDLYVIKFIAPAANNVGASGLDIGSEPKRRAAARHAIDTGEATITGPITLVQDSRKTAGVLLYVPVYDRRASQSTPEQRRASLVGLLFVPIVVEELLAGMPDVGPGRMDFELIDISTPGNTVLIDFDHHIGSLPAGQGSLAGRRFSTTQALALPGRELTLQVSSTPGFDAAIDRSSPWLVFGFGTVLSALLALLLHQQATGRHRAELLAQRMTEELRYDEERARDFSMSASDWFWETDARHRFCYFSDNLEQVYGLAPDQLLGKSRKELLEKDPLNPPEMIEAHLSKLEAHEPFKDFEYSTHTSDGSIRWVSVSGVPHLDALGQFAGYRGTGTIITERKRHAEELQIQNNTLSAVVDNFPGGISLFDKDFRLRAHNAQYRQLLDLPDALFDKPDVYFEDLVHYNAERGDYGPGDVEQQVAASVARARERQPHKFERVRPDGTALEIRGMPLPDGGFVTIHIDVTERKKIMQQLEGQNERLEELVAARTIELSRALEVARQSDQAKDEFLANMSHELRTPLNAVIGMAGLARNLSTEPRQRDYLDKIASSGKHLNRIINDLLDLSKIAAGHMEFETIPFSLHGLILRGNSVMAHRAAEKGLELVETIDDAVPDVLRGDPSRIEQILLNLVGNAVKFTATGRIEVRVGLHGREENRVGIDIDVKDTGVGMRPEDLERLFKPFAQADATVSRKYGGTGLGLTISRRLAEMMDGDISVTSREGIGTTFKLRIWLACGDDADLAATEVAAAVDDVPPPGRYQGAHVLAVDDQPLNREIVAELLAAVGIAARMAENGQEALDILGASGPGAFDAVLMDIQMPVMDGHTATRALRARAGFESLPIIAMTAHTMVHEREASFAAGMSDHIGKPFDTASFYSTLAKWIPGSKHRAVQESLALPEQTKPSNAASGDLSSLRGVDVAAALARLGGNETRYRHWLANFLATAGAIPEQIRGELAAGGADRASKMAHAFKGRVGMLGMTDLHLIVSALEPVLRDGGPSDELLSSLDQAIRQMRDELARVLATGAPDPVAVPNVLEKVTWTDAYSVGVAEMDEQHKKLVGMINQLADCHVGRDRTSSEVFHQVLRAMFDYTQVHFMAEEAYLQEIGYPQRAAHTGEHDAFVEKMTAYSMAAADGMDDCAGVYRYLKEWLLTHILSSDMKYRDCGNANKILAEPASVSGGP